MKRDKVKKLIVDTANEGVTELVGGEQPNKQLRAVLNNLKLFKKMQKRRKQMIKFGLLLTGLFKENGEEAQKCLDVAENEIQKLAELFAKDIKSGYELLDTGAEVMSVLKYAKKHKLIDVVNFGTVPVFSVENKAFDKTQIQFATRPLDGTAGSAAKSTTVNLTVLAKDVEAFTQRAHEAMKEMGKSARNAFEKIARDAGEPNTYDPALEIPADRVKHTPKEGTMELGPVPDHVKTDKGVFKIQEFGLIFADGKVTRYLGSPLPRDLYDSASYVIDLQSKLYLKAGGAQVVGVMPASKEHIRIFDEHATLVAGGPEIQFGGWWGRRVDAGPAKVESDPYDDSDLQRAYEELDQAWEDQMALPPSEHMNPRPLWARLWVEAGYPKPENRKQYQKAGVMIEAAHREWKRWCNRHLEANTFLVNLNDTVEFKVNPGEGKTLWEDYCSKYHKEPKEMKLQLHEFAHVFGPLLGYPTCTPAVYPEIKIIKN